MKIFFDMDGTLSVFRTGIGPDIWSAPGYARTLDPLVNVKDAVKFFLQQPNAYGEEVEVYICSAVVSMTYAVEDKKVWLKEQGLDIPEDNLVFVPYGMSKAKALENAGIDINVGDLFVDDYTKNLCDILDTIPNITPIKLLNGINDTNKSWQYERISAFSSPMTICNSLVAISRMEKSLLAA